jgi:Holliday junction resolvase-like predicted endonuclease
MREVRLVLASIRMIHPDRTPRSERELEELTAAQLRKSGLVVERQKHVKVGRLDLVVVRGTRIVIELKRLATIDCLEQLDRYSKTADALVMVCWRATAPFKETFRTAPSRIPLALVELKQQAPMIP